MRMPRKNLLRTKEFAYHVSARSNNRDWFYLPQTLVWKIFAEKLHQTCEAYSLDIHAFLLMSNHFHLLATTPLKNLDKAMRYLLTEVCRSIQRTSGRINHVFGGRYKWSVLESNWAFAYALKYVYRNPVRAGLVGKVEDYAFSSLTNYEALPILEGNLPYWKYVPREFNDRIKWLNIPTPKEQEELIRKALRHYHFQFNGRRDNLPLLIDLHKNYGIIPVESLQPLPFVDKSR